MNRSNTNGATALTLSDENARPEVAGYSLPRLALVPRSPAGTELEHPPSPAVVALWLEAEGVARRDGELRGRELRDRELRGRELRDRELRDRELLRRAPAQGPQAPPRDVPQESSQNRERVSSPND